MDIDAKLRAINAKHTSPEINARALQVIRESGKMTDEQFESISKLGDLHRLDYEEPYILGPRFSRFLRWLPEKFLKRANVTMTGILISAVLVEAGLLVILATGGLGS